MKNKKYFIYLSVIFIWVLCLNGCDYIISHDVMYEVIGTSPRADIAFTNRWGCGDQLEGVALPWSHSMKADSGSFLSVTASILNVDSKSVQVIIYVDGEKFKSSESIGKKVYARAAGTIPKRKFF